MYINIIIKLSIYNNEPSWSLKTYSLEELDLDSGGGNFDLGQLKDLSEKETGQLGQTV